MTFLLFYDMISTIEQYENRKEYDYEALMGEFQGMAGKLMQKNSTTNGPKITRIVDKYFGKGKKVSDATIEQAELIYLVVEELKEEFKSQLV